MKLVPRDSFYNYFPNLRELNHFFNVELDGEDGTIATSTWVPAVDLSENDNHFLIKADLPGVDPNDIEINMENGSLTIKGDQHKEFNEEKEGNTRIERIHGSFYRRFNLPETADSEEVSARSNKGVLEITVGKKEAVKSKKITVSVQ